MKALYKILPLFAAGALLVSCNEMDTVPNGGYVTVGQKEEVLAKDPSMLSAGAATLPTMTKAYQNVWSGYHNDYGFASIGLASDSRTADMMAYNVPFNWYSGQMMWEDYNENNLSNNQTWKGYYNLIFTSNGVLINVPEEEIEDPKIKFYISQAYAFRAYAYFMLAQYFQFTYKGNEDKPCVPLYTEKNKIEVEEAGGAPRATVEQIYTQIMEDIDNAIAYMEDAGGYSVASTRDKKDFIYLNAAYGLRARINLVMNNWSNAASDAQKAIDLSSEGGIVPYARLDLTGPGFWNAEDHSWMWAIDINENDYQYKYTNTNFVSYMSSFSYSGGYTTLGAWRYAGAKFYDDIPDSDIRKMWWIDGSFAWWWDAPTSTWRVIGGDNEGTVWGEKTSAYRNWVEKNCTMSKETSYLSVKFDRRDGILASEARSGDYPLMRVEEMYLIKAEAEAMAGRPGIGAQILTDFVSSYRDPYYTCSASGAEGVQDAVWNQRRIEFWGEGIAYLDLLRLKKGLDRREQGFQPEACYVIEPTDPIFIYQIPQGEINANTFLKGENNPRAASKPQPVYDPGEYGWRW